MSSVGDGAAKRLVEARARRAISKNPGDPRAALDLGRAFLPGLSPDDAKALIQLAAGSGSSDADSLASADQFRGLSAVEARRVGEIALRGLDGPAAVRELAVDLLADLVRHRPDPLGARIQRELREKAIFEPAILFRDAGIAETREFLALVDRETDPSRIPHLLSCLAWTRHALAAEAFRGWIENPPAWAAGLDIPLADYPPLAGWR